MSSKIFRGAFRRLGSKCVTPNKLKRAGFWEGDEDGGKLCVYGEQTPGRFGGRKGARWEEKRKSVKRKSWGRGQARSAIF